MHVPRSRTDPRAGMDEPPFGYTTPPESPGRYRRVRDVSNYERDETLTDEVEEDADDLGDAAKRGADEAEKGAKSLTDRVTDAVEDAIPGDSDHDGH